MYAEQKLKLQVKNEVRLDKIQRANSKTDLVQLKILILD